MILSRRAVEQYLNRPLRDSERAKSFTDAALDAKLARLNPPPVFHTPPRHHQKAAFLLGAAHPHYLLFLKPGLGKTHCALNLFSHARQKTTEPLRMLVLVPLSYNVRGWWHQVQEHAPHLSIQEVNGSGSGERTLQLHSDADVTVVTYAGFLSLICKTVKKKKKTAWAVDPAKLAAVRERFDFLTFDESTQFRSHLSLTYRVCRSLARTASHAYALTGTPFGGDPEAAWSQFSVIDGGETLGETLGLYRAAFFTPKENYFGGTDWEFKKRMTPTLRRMIRHNAISYSVEECLDLPPLVKTTIDIEFPKETWAYYQRMVDQFRDPDAPLRAKESAFLRMRQLTSGYLALDGEDGSKTEIRFAQNPKLDALMGLLDEFPKDEKVLIFHEYRATGAIVSSALDKAHIKHLRLFSGTKDKGGAADNFVNDPTIRVLLCSSAGAFGGNLQKNCRRTVWMECPCDPITREQEAARNYRDGQKQTTFHFDLIIKGSVDEKILDSVRAGNNLLAQVLSGKTHPVDVFRKKATSHFLS